MAAARPQVTVFSATGAKTTQVRMPEVFLAPIRPDIVHFVHTNMAKNSRQAYAVSREAGHQHSAESWGTGRAVSRIPRVSGGGTSRAGQAAFGNMCRKGRMFAPTRIWRKWHRKINVNQKRYAVASAIAASALPALVMARGHRIAEVPEVPLVMSDDVASISRTKEARAVLVALGAYADVEKAAASRKIRAGQGKLRNRRYVQRRGPLIVHNTESQSSLTKAFRNLPGVELARVESLNLLQLAPGGHVGRFIVWTESAFRALSSIWGSTRRVAQFKKGYKLPYAPMTNTDITRIINSSEVQSHPSLRAAKTSRQLKVLKRNPLKNSCVMDALNPYAAVVRAAEQAKTSRAVTVAARRAANRKLNIHLQKKVNYAKISTDYKVLTKPDLTQHQADLAAAKKAAEEAAAAAEAAEAAAEEALKAKKLAAMQQ